LEGEDFMFKKNEGYFLVELLLALTAWLMIAGVLFPLMIKALNHSVQTDQQYTATKLLYEKLIIAKKEGVIPTYEVFIIGETEYEFLPELNEWQGGMEVCIKYEDIFQKEYKKCEYFE